MRQQQFEVTLQTIRGYIADIDGVLTTDDQKQKIAELYYSSITAAWHFTVPVSSNRPGMV